MKKKMPEESNILEKVKNIFCEHPEHKPDPKLYVPPGHYYVHICPGCLQETKINGPNLLYRG